MPNDTRDRILEAALVMFARNGYVGTNLKEIAQAVGVVKSGFYRHFESKQAVWDAVIDKMERYYTERFGSQERLPEIPKSCDELLALTMRLVNFTICDEKIIMTRKLLLTEQFRDERVRALASRHFLNETKDIFRRIFEGMMATELLIREDAELLALAFTAPITALIHYCDREPEKKPEILGQIEAFVTHFIRIYGRK